VTAEDAAMKYEFQAAMLRALMAICTPDQKQDPGL